MESDTPVTEPATTLNTGQRKQAMREATRRLALKRADQHVVAYLVKEGFTPEEAQDALAPMHRDIDARRSVFVSKQRKRKIFPVLMIVFGVVLIIMGLVVGRPQTLFIAAINIGVGAMNYNKVNDEPFASTLG